jgi:predicted nucleic acid-binding Zn finger protein
MEKSACRGILEAHCNSARMQQDVKKKYLEVLEQKWDKISESVQGENAYRYVFLPSGMQFWLILGKTDEYLLLPPYFCSCHDFYFNAVSKKREICCYHIITQIICQGSSRFITIYKDDGMYLDYLEDLLERD